MKNYVQEGEVITVTAPYALASGDGALIGSIFGVATGAAASGANVELLVAMGVVALTCLPADIGTVGTKVYWDNTNRRITVSATGNSLVGVLTVAKQSAETTATLRLNGVSV